MGDDDPKEIKIPSEVKFDFIKSNYFRVIHADGVFGGITPGLGIHLSYFNERQPIPKQIVHQTDSKGVIGAEIADRRIERDALVREVEVDVIMNYATAKAVHKWFSDMLALLEKARVERGEMLRESPENKQ